MGDITNNGSIQDIETVEILSEMSPDNPYSTNNTVLPRNSVLINLTSSPTRVAALTQKINCLHIISAKKMFFTCTKNIITDMGRTPLFQYNY